jgi:hypothetical protein
MAPIVDLAVRKVGPGLLHARGARHDQGLAEKQVIIVGGPLAIFDPDPCGLGGIDEPFCGTLRRALYAAGSCSSYYPALGRRTANRSPERTSRTITYMTQSKLIAGLLVTAFTVALA